MLQQGAALARQESLALAHLVLFGDVRPPVLGRRLCDYRGGNVSVHWAVEHPVEAGRTPPSVRRDGFSFEYDIVRCIQCLLSGAFQCSDAFGRGRATRIYRNKPATREEEMQFNVFADRLYAASVYHKKKYTHGTHHAVFASLSGLIRITHPK